MKATRVELSAERIRKKTRINVPSVARTIKICYQLNANEDDAKSLWNGLKP